MKSDYLLCDIAPGHQARTQPNIYRGAKMFKNIYDVHVLIAKAKLKQSTSALCMIKLSKKIKTDQFSRAPTSKANCFEVLARHREKI